MKLRIIQFINGICNHFKQKTMFDYNTGIYNFGQIKNVFGKIKDCNDYNIKISVIKQGNRFNRGWLINICETDMTDLSVSINHKDKIITMTGILDISGNKNENIKEFYEKTVSQLLSDSRE